MIKTDSLNFSRGCRKNLNKRTLRIIFWKKSAVARTSPSCACHMYLIVIYPVQVLEDEGIWWKVRVHNEKTKSGLQHNQLNNDGGYAAKYYFVHKNHEKDHEKEPWYFGDMTREEAEHLLGDNANPDGILRN